jgi:hypothetical protein
MRKTVALTAIAVLAVPAVAQAARPDDAGSKGSQTAAEHTATEHKPATKQKQSQPKPQRVGFTVKGILGDTLPTVDPATGVVSDVSLDIASANKAARAKLGLDKAGIAAATQTLIDIADDDKVVAKLVGVTDGPDAGTDVSFADIAKGDTVKLIGKVQRTRTKTGKGKPSFTYGALDIRQVVVTRGSSTDS